MKLNDLSPQRGTQKNPKRVGRGSGSGHGKTSGRGNKGLGARTGGGFRPGFEGGQTPLIRRIPKRGFINIFKKEFQVVNIGSLNTFRKDDTVSPKELLEVNLIRKKDVPVKILATGELRKSLTIMAHAFSKKAVAQIEQAGGKAERITRELKENEPVKEIKKSSERV